VLDKIDADFSLNCRTAIRGIEYGNAVKIAWQARRFWETDDHIYGGISWGPTTMVWCPSDRMFSPKGILLGAYSTRDDADLLTARPLAAQLELSRAAIEALHPGCGKELESPMAIAWSRVPTALGSQHATIPTTMPIMQCSASPTAHSISQVSISAISALGRKARSCQPDGPST
jgi:monoamine oxidase